MTFPLYIYIYMCGKLIDTAVKSTSPHTNVRENWQNKYTHTHTEFFFVSSNIWVCVCVYVWYFTLLHHQKNFSFIYFFSFLINLYLISLFTDLFLIYFYLWIIYWHCYLLCYLKHFLIRLLLRQVMEKSIKYWAKLFLASTELD